MESMERKEKMQDREEKMQDRERRRCRMERMEKMEKMERKEKKERMERKEKNAGEKRKSAAKEQKNIPFRVQYKLFFLYLHPKGYNYFKRLPLKKFTAMDMSLSSFVKERRKQLNLTQTDLAEKSGVGLRFVRELEQGKQTLRMDKINQVLALFGHEVGAVPAASLRQ